MSAPEQENPVEVLRAGRWMPGWASHTIGHMTLVHYTDPIERLSYLHWVLPELWRPRTLGRHELRR